MKTATVSEFRSKMKEHLEDIQKDQDILILSGPKKKDFVLITLEQYNAMEETAHLLSTPANTKRLLESIAQDRKGIVVVSSELSEKSKVRRVLKRAAVSKKPVSKARKLKK